MSSFLCFYLLVSDKIATTRNATPASSSFPPVSHQTIKAIIPAGKTKKTTLATKMITNIPIINNAIKAKSPSNPREPRTKNDMNKYTVTININTINFTVETNYSEPVSSSAIILRAHFRASANSCGFGCPFLAKPNVLPRHL